MILGRCPTRLIWPAFLVLFGLLFVACSGADKNASASADGTEAPASATPPAATSGRSALDQAHATSTAVAAVTATAEAAFWLEAEAAATPAASFQITAEGFSFDKPVIAVPQGSTVQVTFVNKDNIAHNFAIYRDETYQDKVFAADLVTEPGSVEFSFEAPPPGTYYFICQPHRGAMYGRFIVK